jgi:hypothetical protein
MTALVNRSPAGRSRPEPVHAWRGPASIVALATDGAQSRHCGPSPFGRPVQLSGYWIGSDSKAMVSNAAVGRLHGGGSKEASTGTEFVASRGHELGPSARGTVMSSRQPTSSLPRLVR